MKLSMQPLFFSVKITFVLFFRQNDERRILQRFFAKDFCKAFCKGFFAMDFRCTIATPLAEKIVNLTNFFRQIINLTKCLYSMKSHEIDGLFLPFLREMCSECKSLFSKLYRNTTARTLLGMH